MLLLACCIIIAYSINLPTNIQANLHTYESCDKSAVHALILARGGSKGVRGKNLVRIGSESLLARTLNTIKRSELGFEEVWVSTDNEAIAAEALKLGAQIHWRAAAFAEDNTTSLAAVQEFLFLHHDIERVALFQCTAVFMRTIYVEKAQRLFQCNDCVFAVTRSHKLRWRQQNDGKLEAINFNPGARPRRQDWAGELLETGMFYFSTRKLIMVENRFQNARCQIVEVPQKDTLEIDTPEDLELARCLLEANDDNFQ